MVTNVLNEGILVINKKISPKNVEREIFIRLPLCYDRYSYSHKVRNCYREKQVICAYCGELGHHAQNCTATNPRCINCNAGHQTLVAACPHWKEIIKSKIKEIRENSHSHSRTRTYVELTST